MVNKGDFWPNVLEDSIKEIEMEHQKQQQLMDTNKSDPSGNDKTMDDDSIGIVVVFSCFNFLH